MLETKMYYTYVLQSLKDMNFYTGFTKNLKQRFEQHKKGLVESTNGKMYLKRRLKSYLTGRVICESEASETQYWIEVIVETKWLSWEKVNKKRKQIILTLGALVHFSHFKLYCGFISL